MTEYFRPIVQHTNPRPPGALTLAGGAGWFTDVMVHRRGAAPEWRPARDLPEAALDALTRPRADIAGLSMDRPRIMGILNVTPDSFSDGGTHAHAAAAVRHGQELAAQGADMIDIGGESTRPGAATVPVPAEIARIEPVITGLRHLVPVPLSIDTRKSSVAEAAIAAGARLVNDVSGFTYDKMLAPFAARNNLPVCIMHAQGDPETMQDDPRYDDVLLDIYDFLAAQVIFLENLGIPRDRIVIDPGIGFGKTVAHNLAILNGISIFHGIGCPILLGASRKGFIGKLADAHPAAARAPGSVAVALAAVAQGVQFLRVHDVAETRQALTLWQAVEQVEQGEHHVA
ncbi:dihydropteroate synthase [Aestuariicoccus sp. MJ-SS9]|uniref:dihydropteroate synthase n=1 Tax=Aestuariicoccus sp. MJ-SS9 TaxID=3079855 RepID=UPI00290DC413|nr:dihydropteroate synthase [Aestuariicoccus sp. MJ-SS9]MDU8911937.1 dihydropteroate synthase [Aestuariicoccus sp. MJ-SS9]